MFFLLIPKEDCGKSHYQRIMYHINVSDVLFSILLAICISLNYYQFQNMLCRAYEREVQPVHGPEPGEPWRGLWNSEGPNILNHRCFILIFLHLFWYCQLFLVYFEKSLFKIHLDFRWKLTSGFIDMKSTILREISACSRGPKTVLFRLVIFLLEALMLCNIYLKYISL